jgi:hypothetical protein
MNEPVFISHSSKDQKVARTICGALEMRGLRCWLASRDVHPGENFQESIARAIRTAKVMVLVFTKNANDSAEIKKEIALASQNQLVVIPVRIEDVLPNDALAYELVTRQWIDLFQDWEVALERLATRISAVVAIEPTAASGRTDAVASADAGASVAGPMRPAIDADGRSIGAAAYTILSLNTHLLAGFFLCISAFLLILMMVFVERNNFAGAFAASVASLAIGMVGQRTLDKDDTVRLFGVAIGVAGLIAVGAINIAPQFFRIGLLESSSIQNGLLLMAILFFSAIQFFGVEWTRLKNPSWKQSPMQAKIMNLLTSRWGARLVFVSIPLFVSATWEILYRLTGSIAILVALIGCHLAILVYCYLRYRKDIAANAAGAAPPAPA